MPFRYSSFTSQLNVLVAVFSLLVVSMPGVSQAAGSEGMAFKRIPLQFIAALGDPGASSGNNAQDWGLWRIDPGPRGVRLRHFQSLQEAGGVAPAQWRFDRNDWWLEEYGRIMEAPEFPLAPGRYIVTGDREAVSLLTIHPADTAGNLRWELSHGATLHEVTHLGCRSARYRPASAKADCSPARAPRSAFRVAPGAAMPQVEGCIKQDYAVLFVIGVPIDS